MSDSGWTASNLLCEMRQIMTRYDFLLHRQVILSNVRTDSQLNLINFSCELGQIMTRYYLLAIGTIRVILSQLDLILILVNFWMGANRWIFWEKSGVTTLSRFYIALNWGDKWFLPSKKTNSVDIQSSRFRWYSFVFERTQSRLVSLLVKFSQELGKIMIRYDFLWDRRMILSNVRTDSNLT